jgi:hypothetical protein
MPGRHEGESWVGQHGSPPARTAPSRSQALRYAQRYWLDQPVHLHDVGVAAGERVADQSQGVGESSALAQHDRGHAAALVARLEAVIAQYRGVIDLD